MEGSAKKGLTITVRFDSPVHVTTLPQYSSDRVAFKYLPLRDYRRASAQTQGSELWAIELEPRARLLRADQMPRALLLDRTLYLPPGKGSDTVSPRLGFFGRDKARSVLAEVRGTFPNARLVAVSRQEAAYARAMRLNSRRLTALLGAGGPARVDQGRAEPVIAIAAATTGTITDPEPPPEPKLVNWAGEVDDSLLEQAKDAYIAGDYGRAIACYTQASNMPAFRLEALEMLGVTREQTRQLAQAKLAYQTALAEFPDRPEAERIRARLQALVSIDRQPRTLRAPRRIPDAAAWQTSIFASQFYQRYSLHIDRQGTTVPVAGVFSDVDMSIRRSTASASHEGRISLGHLLDFTDRAGDRDIRIEAAYWESSVERLRTTVRLGRQSDRSSGVLGRFDGVNVTYQARPGIDVSVLGGYLLDSGYDHPAADRPFWGANADIELLNHALTVTPFYVQQMIGGVVDRQAAGLQSEVDVDNGVYFGMLDYDLHHQALNHALLTANLRLGNSTRVFGTVERRRNPYLTTRDALIGQPVDDLSDLELLLANELVNARLEDIAADRTAESTALQLGVDRRLGDEWSVSVDSGLTSFGSTNASANVAALDSYGDFYMTVQVRSENVLGRGNFGSVQMRYYRSDTTTTTGVNLTNRVALGEQWWLLPRLSADRRIFGTGGRSQLRLKPSLRLDYRPSRRFSLQLEAGYEWMTRDLPGGALNSQGLLIVAGWRAAF